MNSVIPTLVTQAEVPASRGGSRVPPLSPPQDPGVVTIPPCHPSAGLSHIGDVGAVTRSPFLSTKGRCKAYWIGDAARELLQGITDP